LNLQGGSNRHCNCSACLAASILRKVQGPYSHPYHVSLCVIAPVWRQGAYCSPSLSLSLSLSLSSLSLSLSLSLCVCVCVSYTHRPSISLSSIPHRNNNLISCGAVWAEANPLSSTSLKPLLVALHARGGECTGKLGLDTTQVCNAPVSVQMRICVRLYVSTAPV
jgi:hypothetical protein